MKVVFVCTGNTCRSPMAEVFAELVFKNAKLDIQAQSRGLFVSESLPASDYAKLAVRNYGLSLENHMAKQLTKEDIEEADLILTMTIDHKKMLGNICPPEKLYTLKGYALGTDGDISDPFGQSPAIYLECAEEIIDCIGKVAGKLVGNQKGDVQ
ncbi:Protein-arginine-phosphatase [bioreactor metagenome]|uniref:Protein-arginine-phosphatase n=1 Tax=bioreactor metagenome TaxID=1076179 RepID=A0A645BTP8_9ZZZZ|nr:low molecular weight protein arginine phosphatase [Candidatus Metalachnospira sp.]